MRKQLAHNTTTIAFCLINTTAVNRESGGDVSQLGEAEKFMLEMTAVPARARRLQAMVFKEQVITQILQCLQHRERICQLTFISAPLPLTASGCNSFALVLRGVVHV